MTLKQAFIASYLFLDIFYQETKDERFLDIISGMNPFLWADGSSADPAAIYDWAFVAKRITEEEHLSSKQSYYVMYEYVKFFKTEFGFDFDWIMEGLLKKTHNSPEWLNCVDKAMKFLL